MKYEILRKNVAFSLAEVLIVIGLIGIVASLTLPNLNSSTNKKEMVTRYMKVYAELSAAAGSAVAKYGPITSWVANASTDTEKSTIVGKRLLSYMKVSKECGIDTDNTNAKCGTSGTVKYMKTSGGAGGIYTDSNKNDYKAILANGISISISGYGTPSIEVDIDGRQNSYMWGKDYFGFNIDSDTGEVKPYGWDKTEADMLSDCKSIGQACGNWVVRAGNMDYLKCPDSLTWTNTTCK